MFGQERTVFILKGSRAMVFCLIQDVSSGDVELRLADRKCPISLLPGKIRSDVSIHPFRGSALDQLNQLCDGNSGRNFQQQMNVVFDASDLHGDCVVFAGDAAQVRVETWHRLDRNQRSPSLGAEHHMDVGDDIGVRHRVFRPSAVPTGLT